MSAMLEQEARVLRQTLEAIFRGVWVGEDAVHDIQHFARNGLRQADRHRAHASIQKEGE